MADYRLNRPKGSRKTKRVVGRGAAARRGATAGRGTKGQNSRSGGGVAPGFEGGQMPLYRRLARRGFNNKRFQDLYRIVNIGEIAKRFSDGDVVNAESLKEKKLVKGQAARVKILGVGEIDVKVTVSVDSVSRGAREKIEKAGGSVAEEKVESDGE